MIARIDYKQIYINQSYENEEDERTSIQIILPKRLVSLLYKSRVVKWKNWNWFPGRSEDGYLALLQSTISP